MSKIVSQAQAFQIYVRGHPFHSYHIEYNTIITVTFNKMLIPLKKGRNSKEIIPIIILIKKLKDKLQFGNPCYIYIKV